MNNENEKRKNIMSNQMFNNVTFNDNCSNYFNSISENPQKIINLNNKLFNNILSNDFIVGTDTRNNNNNNNITSIDLTERKFQYQYRNYQNSNIYNNNFMQGGIDTRKLNVTCNN